eukprot:TRINITY_DN650_c0_g4_i2.p1 TRINITY_DN650_c0_g4~~TRINITY_DN650_c0_g4_i2.p1  ORF type:complete len:444 (-),score=125.28 TRINITY_DN650_c0_g4_i2:59-1390(-)
MGQGQTAKVKETLTKEEIAKEHTRRTHIAKEILSTETTYVNTLRNIANVWVVPLMEAITKKLQPVISVEDINAIFSNAAEILAIHEEMVSEFQKRIDNWNETQLIGDIFLKNAVALTLYTTYVNNYDQSMMTIERLLKNKDFSKFVSERSETKANIILPSLLIQPIQRIPRYRLLLEDLAKHTWISHPDYTNLQIALDHIKVVSADIDEQKGKYENRSRLSEIQREIGKKYQIKDREILSEGTVEIGQKTVQYCLTPNYLIIWTKPGGIFSGNPVQLFAALSELGKKKEENGTIRIIHKDAILELTVKNPDDWYDLFCKAHTTCVKLSLQEKTTQIGISTSDSNTIPSPRGGKALSIETKIKSEPEENDIKGKEKEEKGKGKGKEDEEQKSKLEKEDKGKGKDEEKRKEKEKSEKDKIDDKQKELEQKEKEMKQKEKDLKKKK